ncbi:zinc-finger-containing protein [Pseudenterobacter timonensis]|uniref:Zinc-finger-containing protein n=1 Tax=Pseudenterobacter timonensis TaxID=1755099 RepID=A0AAE4DLW1_9ENTR|nr:zinc-finger-containing protein [Pseudenterobacter timonensis]MDR9889879.1 zinc-finger-containing protein [Pseudenterobacter timonensis]
MDIKTPSNPSRKATARVKNPLPAPTQCHHCSGLVRIGTHEEVYGRDYSDWPYVYLCEGCGAYVGLHPFTAIPLGTLADKRTREARKSCKLPFERIWRSGRMSRTEAYKWLADKMGIPTDECHFGWFSAEQCQTAMTHCNEWLSR